MIDRVDLLLILMRFISTKKANGPGSGDHAGHCIAPHFPMHRNGKNNSTYCHANKQHVTKTVRINKSVFLFFSKKIRGWILFTFFISRDTWEISIECNVSNL